MTHGEIRNALKSYFDIKISEKDLLEMLIDMQATGEIQKIKKGALGKNRRTSRIRCQESMNEANLIE